MGSAQEPSTEAPSTEAPSAEVPSAQEPPAQDPADVYGGLAEDVDADAESTVPVTTLPDGEKAPEPSAQEPSTEAPSTEVPSAEVPSAEVPSAQEPPAQDPADVYGGLAEDVDADAESTVPVTTLPDGEKA